MKNAPVKGAFFIFYGGAERDRTADLDIANVALSQLSYSPAPTKIPAPRRARPGRGRFLEARPREVEVAPA